MVEAFMRLTSSKGWHYFWLLFSIIFMVIDLATGSYVYSVAMFLLALFWSYQLNEINKGNHYTYNKYHQVKD